MEPSRENLSLPRFASISTRCAASARSSRTQLLESRSPHLQPEGRRSRARLCRSPCKFHPTWFWRVTSTAMDIPISFCWMGQLNSAGAYQVLLNDGKGNFSAAGSGTLPTSSVTPIAVGDFNHDGKLDFVCAGSATGQPFSFYFGNGDGTFAAPATLDYFTYVAPTVALLLHK